MKVENTVSGGRPDTVTSSKGWATWKTPPLDGCFYFPKLIVRHWWDYIRTGFELERRVGELWRQKGGLTSANRDLYIIRDSGISYILLYWILLEFALVRPPFLLAQTDGLQIQILVDTGFMGGLSLLHHFIVYIEGKYLYPQTSM